MPDPQKQEPAVVVGKAYDLVLWLYPKVERFPRSYRMSLGRELTTNGLELLMSLVQSAYASDKAGLLQKAGLKANTLRYLLRLAKDLHIITADSYGYSTGEVEEIGRMVGGWYRSVGKRA
ncbi:MAG: diversity-generating retroelement protein Avd [Bryobacteraceae bacterium]|nr:diversity-generating retroelement protein Avd [Bryobacteraceae bacterium]